MELSSNVIGPLEKVDSSAVSDDMRKKWHIVEVKAFVVDNGDIWTKFFSSKEKCIEKTRCHATSVIETKTDMPIQFALDCGYEIVEGT